MARFPSLSPSWSLVFVWSLALFSTLIPLARADDDVYITGTDAKGVSRSLLDSRYPALYTGDFGDCMGGQSLINVTRFDAAYYADNMTVSFHLGGHTSLRNESVVLYISVYAYGEDRFHITFNPCSANFDSLCPMSNAVPIFGVATIPVSSSDVSGIPPIALGIPDFEGSAIIRIFSNSTKTEIACFSAVMRNGASFSHPGPVGSVLGLFTIVAIAASFATAVYGVSVPHIRTHYAHSLSVLVVFEVFHSIFFSGALSVNWPSVCSAFWSNFAWSAGIINAPGLISSLNSFAGVTGNSSQVGGAGSAVLNNNGGLQQQIYGRSFESISDSESRRRGEELASRIYKRASNSSSSRQYSWAGGPVAPGLPLPGNWTGFPGTLSEVGVPAADVFLTGFIWLVILVLTLVLLTALFKWSLECFSSRKWIKQDRLALFRSHWLGFTGLVVLRSLVIAFFMMMTLTIFQFSYGGKAGVTAIAVIVFMVFFIGMLGLAFYACFFRMQFGRYASLPDRIHFQSKKALKIIPWFTTVRESELDEAQKTKSLGSISFFRLEFIAHDAARQNVHDDMDYTKRFGFLSARFRRTRWWYFSVWVVYQIGRACFIGGGRGNPNAQVYGLFVWEIIAFIVIVNINPFEGSRNTSLAVWMLSISKIATAGLTIAFLPQFNLARIPTTVLGIIIILVQGFMVIAMMILIVLGAISSYMSLTRNREQVKPYVLENIRLKYFGHIEQKAIDLPPAPPPEPEEPKEPYFSVNAVHRAPKIEDEEDIDYVPDLSNANYSHGSIGLPNSRSNSMASHYSGFGGAPFGARVHRASWSSRDFQNWQAEEVERGNSPFGTPSRYNLHNSTNSISMTPLVRPSGSQNSMRPATPTREQQNKFASQRVSHAM